MLALDSAKRITGLPPEAKAAFRAVLMDLRKEAADKAQTYWKHNKAITAAYWKAVSIWAGHFARLAR
ncbi:MAG TPA: hypothetical protein VGF56_05965 [Rhizomicrobium sp.]